MRIMKNYADAAMFARWCQRESLDPTDVAELMTLATLEYRAAERELMHPNYPAERVLAAAKKVDAKAESMGLSVTRSGLFPGFQNKEGFTVHPPILGRE
jgi:hypothetical protein